MGWTLQKSIECGAKAVAASIEELPTPCVVIMVGAHTARYRAIKDTLSDNLESCVIVHSENEHQDADFSYKTHLLFPMNQVACQSHQNRHRVVQSFFQNGAKSVVMVYIEHDPDKPSSCGKMPASRAPQDPQELEISNAIGRNLRDNQPSAPGVTALYLLSDN